MAVGLAALLALVVGPAGAVPGTQVWTGQPDGATPDIERGSLTFFDGADDPIPSGGLAGTINFTLDGVAYVGYCIDTSRFFSTDPEPVDIVAQQPPASPANRAVAWILLNRAPTGAPTAEKAEQAAVSQVATWLLVDSQISQTNPTSDPSLNAAAAALAQEAREATATPAALAVSIAPPPAGATSTTVTVTGRPDAVVQLAVTGGTGALSAPAVTLGADGTATVTLTGAPDVVAISATTAGDGRLFLVTPTDPERRGQPTAAAQPTQLSATAQVAFQAAPPAPGAGAPSTPATPPLVPVAQSPSLAIVKRAPARSLVLRPVRYRITVRNTSRVVARNVVLRDRIPSGLAFVKASRRATFRRGVITFRLGTLRPGQRRTINVWLRANANVRGTRVNVATVSATSARPRRARVAVRFRAPLRRIQPAVTG